MWQELQEKCLMFCWGKPKERGHMEEPDVESINIKIDFPQIRQEGVNGIDLAQDKDNRWGFANTVMTFGLHNNRRRAVALSYKQERPWDFSLT